MPLKDWHCQVPELANSDTCPRPTTHLEGLRRPGVGPPLPAAHLRELDGINDSSASQPCGLPTAQRHLRGLDVVAGEAGDGAVARFLRGRALCSTTRCSHHT